MNELITINNVRGYLDENGTAQLNLEDVSRGLGFVQVKNDVEYIRWETVLGYLRDFGFSQQVGKEDFIPENIFYKLCFKASNETARKFQDIVTDEILPEIRKTGSYSIALPALDSRFMFQIAQRMEEQEKLIEELTPKAEFADKLLKSKDSILVREFAKIMFEEKVITFGEKKLYSWFRDGGYLMKNNEPYQQYMQYFEIQERPIDTPFGQRLTHTTKITPSGQLYFYHKLKNQHTQTFQIAT